MKEQLRGVAKAITKTEGEIDRVTAQISELVDEINAVRGRRDEETVRRLEKEKEQLRDEKNLLLKEKEQLRDKENLLLKKEQQLRDKEKMLMEREQGGKQPGRQSPLEGQ